MSPVPIWYGTLNFLLIILQLGGGLLAFSQWARLGATYRLVAGWLVWTAVAAIVYRVTTLPHEAVQYVAQVWYPISGCLALWMVATLLHGKLSRHAMQAIALIYLGAMLSLLFDVRRAGDHFRLANTVHATAIFVAGISITVLRLVRARVDLLTDPEFLVGAAFVVLGGASAFVAVSPFWESFSSPELLLRLLAVRNLFQLLAVVVLLRGVWLDMHSRARSA